MIGWAAAAVLLLAGLGAVGLCLGARRIDRNAYYRGQVDGNRDLYSIGYRHACADVIRAIGARERDTTHVDRQRIVAREGRQ